MADVRKILALEGPDSRWLVGVSGGGDSVALLRVLVGEGWRERLIVGNFNHGWGEFGAKSQAFVRGLCGELGVEFVTGKGRQGKATSNAEAAARAERGAWFRQVCADERLAGAMVAHTRDDVAEGFLMRAGKGSGLRGLQGMGERGEGVWRPLVGVGREELREYLRGLGQEWLEDPDNEAGGSQRARVRKLLPALEGVGVAVEGIAASALALADAEAVVEQVVEGMMNEGQWVGGGFSMELRLLREALREVGVRVLGRIIAELGDEGMVVRRGKRVALWERMGTEDKGVATLGGVKFTWDGGVVVGKAERSG